MDGIVGLIFFTVFALLNPVVLLKLKKPQHILLSAALIAGPWQGGLWLAPVKFELRLTFLFMIAALALSIGKPSKLKPKIPQLIMVPLIGLVVWTIIGASMAFDMAIALGDGAVTMTFNLLFLIAIVKIIQKIEDLEFVLKSIFLGMFYVILLSLFQYKIRMFHLGFIDSGHIGFMWWRPRATFNHPNAFGLYLLILIPILFRQIILKLKAKDKKAGRNYIILFCLAGFAFLITQNRGSWVGLIIAMVLTIFLDFFQKGSKKTRKTMMRILVTFLILSIYPATRYGPRMYERMFVGKNAISSKADSRKSYNEDAWIQFHKKPITGVGVSNVRYYSRIIFTHNLYLLILSETGVVGFTLFIFYMIGHLKVALKVRKAREPYVANMGTGFFTTLIALFIASVPGPDYGISSQVSCPLWIVSGIMISLNGIYEQALKQQKLKKRKQQVQKKIGNETIASRKLAVSSSDYNSP